MNESLAKNSPAQVKENDTAANDEQFSENLIETSSEPKVVTINTEDSANDQVYESEALLRADIEHINESVRNGELSTSVADILVKELENKIYGLEKQPNHDSLSHDSEQLPEDKLAETKADGFDRVNHSDVASNQISEETNPLDSPTPGLPPYNVAVSKIPDYKSPDSATELKPGVDVEAVVANKAEIIRNFKDAQREYYTALETSHKNRTLLHRLISDFKGYKEYASGQSKNADGTESLPPVNSTLSKEAREYYAKLPFFNRVFGGNKEDRNPDLEAAHAKFIAANKARHDFGLQSGAYDWVAKRLGRGKKDISPKSLIADRHVLKPAEKRLELQTVQLPEGLARVKDKIVATIQAHPKKMLALTFVTSFLNPLRVGTGLAANYLGSRFLVKPKEAQREAKKSEIVNTINTDSQNFAAQEEAYFERLNELRKAKIKSRVLTTGAVLAAGGLSHEAFADELDVTKVGDRFANGVIHGPSADASIDILPETKIPVKEFTSLEINVEEPTTHSVVRVNPLDSVGPKEAISIENPSLEVGNIGGVKPEVAAPYTEDAIHYDHTPPAEQSASGAYNKYFAENNPHGPSGVEKPSLEIKELGGLNAEAGFVDKLTHESLLPKEINHEVARGENLSTILSNKLRALVDSGDYKLPEGMTRDEITHRMYQTFPEMTKATHSIPKLSHDQWVELGVKSGNPNLIHPGETINVQRLVEIMGYSPSDGSVPLPTQPNIDALGNIKAFDAPDLVTKGHPPSPGVGNIDGFDSPNLASGNSSAINFEIKNPSLEIPEIDSDKKFFDPLTQEPLTAATPEHATSTENISAQLQKVAENLNSSVINPDAKLPYPAQEVFIKGIPVGPDGKALLSPELAKLTVELKSTESLHKFMVNSLSDAVQKGSIKLPTEVMNGTKDMWWYTEQKLPEISGSLGAPSGQTFTPDQWKQFGYQSGNPRVNTPGDVIKVGEIFKYFVKDQSLPGATK